MKKLTLKHKITEEILKHLDCESIKLDYEKCKIYDKITDRIFQFLLLDKKVKIMRSGKHTLLFFTENSEIGLAFDIYDIKNDTLLVEFARWFVVETYLGRKQITAFFMENDSKLLTKDKEWNRIVLFNLPFLENL